MKITLSVDKKTAERARKVARAMGTTLNRLLRDHLERLAGRGDMAEVAGEFRRLSLKAGGDSRGWRLDRDSLHQRT